MTSEPRSRPSPAGTHAHGKANLEATPGASTSLESHVGKQAPPVPYYTGLECYKQSLYPAKECPYMGMCLPGSTCTTWRYGAYNLDYATSDPQTKLTGCSCGADCAGRYVRERWTPHLVKCPGVWLSPRQMLDRFRGRRMVLSGDSLVRQVFLRIVAHLRGLDAIVEHPFKAHATFLMNMTHDVLTLHDEFGTRRTEGYLTGARHVDIQYWRSPSGLPSRGGLDASHAQIAVMAINLNCTEDCFKERNVPEQMDALLKDSHHLEHIVWLTTAGRHGKWRKDYSQGNAAMRTWAAEAQKHTNVTVTIVAVDKLVKQSPWGRNMGGDDAHFQCSFLDEHPAIIRKDAMKTPDTVDCRDLLNLNVAQLIMGSI
jgi:hypothetical protein